MEDDDDDVPNRAGSSYGIVRDAASQDDAEDDEQDPDCPYPSIIQDVDLDVGSEVLRIATPSFFTSSERQRASLTSSHIIIAASCGDGRVLLLTAPMEAPRTVDKRAFVKSVHQSELQTEGVVGQHLSIKLLPEDDAESMDTTQHHRHPTAIDCLLVVQGKSLLTWQLRLATESIETASVSKSLQSYSAVSTRSVSFSASAHSRRLLVSDRPGVVHIYDVSAAEEQSTSRESTSRKPAGDSPGKCIMSYHTSFHFATGSPTIARRKRILDAKWVLGDQCVLVLLEDGEWGVWDLQALPPPGKTIEDFAVSGYLASSSMTHATETGQPKKTGSKLAPMTPNTRQAKAGDLFNVKSKAPGVAATGGIDVSTTSTRSGQIDEAVIIWYNNDIYSIPSMQTFWQRRTNRSGPSGSLYAPDLVHVSGINLMQENITSISQFVAKQTPARHGQMNIGRDLLVSAEHRFVILQSNRPQGSSSGGLFGQVADRVPANDQKMLDVGELDLGGVDRMLDSMGADTRTRRVGFAH